MKKAILLLGLIMLILAACQDGESQPDANTVPPTEAVEPAPPAEEPTEMPPAAEEEAAVEPTAESLGDEEVIEEPTAEPEAEEKGVEEPPAEAAITSWDALLEQTVATCGAPGAVLLVDSPEGRYLRAFGQASVEDGTEVQVTDAFEIGSNTKSFTTAIAVQLQEEGLWSLDDPLSLWLPDVAARLPYGDEITLRQMAQNHSGIYDYATPMIGESISSGNYEQGYTPEEIIDYIVENGEPVAEPGTDEAWNYSSSNYHILAMAIEAATGQQLADLYQERIFTPLGMEDSFLLEGVPEPGQIVNGYYTEEGETSNTTTWNASQGWAAGGIVSTAEDMARYIEGLSAGDLFQDPGSLEQMLNFGDGLVALYTGYGLGIGSYNGYGDLVGYGHAGQTAGFQSIWAVFPEQEVSLVLLTNSASCGVTMDFMFPLAMNSQLLTSGSPDGEDSSDTEGESANAAQPAPLPDETVAQLDEFLGTQLYTEGMNPQSGAPGVILLVDTPDGRYFNAAGVSNLEEGTPMQVGDRVEIGSNTKSFTVALLMQLQEEGVLSMDDPLSAWLPEWADLIPYGDEVTLRQMAQHTSGIWDYGDPIIGDAASNPVHLEDFYTPEELVQYAIDNGTPDFKPGEEGQWKYSNTGYILLGMVLEAATGEKLGDLYQTRIFDPLGLESAVFIQDIPEPHEIINGYNWTEDGHELNNTKWNVSQGWSAGGIAMTAEDLLTYAEALAAGELFQDPDSLEQMVAFDPDGMDGYMPAGLGLLDFSLIGAPGSWGHEGQTAGFQTLWFTNPQTDVTVVGLSNSAAYQAYNFLRVASIVSP